MRPSQYRILFALVAACGAGIAAAAWDPVVSLKGERIELDRSRIARLADGRATAWSRLVLGRDFIDETGMRYTDVEALNRYDCEKHAFATLKRIYKRDGKTVRSEPVNAPKELAAEPGSADDKLLTEACKAPALPALASLAQNEVKAGVVYADVRSEAAAKAKNEKPDAKADPKAAAKGDAKAADKPAEGESKGERPRYIDLPKIDKSQVEDPNAPPKADAKDAKSAKQPAKEAPKEKPVAEKPKVVDRATSAYRAELERQYASSGPRRVVAKPKKAEPPPEPAIDYSKIHWSYEGDGGPANWGKLRADYATCAEGQRQSPIDIRDTIRVDLEPILFDYKLSRFAVIDNGHTIQVNVDEGNKMHIMDRTYRLVQFHFHKPAEERINGRTFDMVVHLVHQDDAGRLAVIAVPLEKGAEHPLIQTIWNNLPLARGEDVSPPWTIDPNLLLPPPDRRGYATYMGSLTTPPCTEDVLWMVFKQPVAVSAQQIAIFARLYNNNARPIQPANGRLIKENR